jgi:hypothetical protein
LQAEENIKLLPDFCFKKKYLKPITMKKTISFLFFVLSVFLASAQNKTNDKQTSYGWYATYDDYKNGKLIPFDLGEFIKEDEYGKIFYKTPQGETKSIWPHKLIKEKDYWGVMDSHGKVARLAPMYKRTKKGDEIDEKGGWSEIINKDDSIVLYGSAEKNRPNMYNVQKFSRGLEGHIYRIGQMDSADNINTNQARDILISWLNEEDSDLAEKLSKEKLGVIRASNKRVETLVSYMQEYNARVKAREQKAK